MNWMDLSEYSYKNGFEKGKLKGALDILGDIAELVSKKCGEIEDRAQSSQDFYWGETYAYKETLRYVSDKLDELMKECTVNKVEV